jgi:hypothetical protein
VRNLSYCRSNTSAISLFVVTRSLACVFTRCDHSISPVSDNAHTYVMRVRASSVRGKSGKVRLVVRVAEGCVIHTRDMYTCDGTSYVHACTSDLRLRWSSRSRS